MKNTLYVVENPLEPHTAQRYEGDIDIRDLLEQALTEWKDTYRLYHGSVSMETDITPATEQDIERLGTLSGTFYVVVYPKMTIVIIIVAIAVLSVLAKLFMPKTPDQAESLQRSSNNELADRTNRERINERIPDIYGTVRSVPDLIQKPYRTYEGNKLVEISYMTVGAGEYEISDVRDGDTLLTSLAGASAAFYGPNTSPNSGHSPQLLIGSPIDEPLRRVTRMEQVSGQALPFPNTVLGTTNGLYFEYPNVLTLISGGLFTEYFNAGNVVTISDAIWTGTLPLTVNGLTKYVHNAGTPYAEFQSGSFIPFNVGEVVTITGHDYTLTKKPETIESTVANITVTTAGLLTFTTTPVGDFRTGQSITIAGLTKSYDFTGTFTVTAKPSSKKLVLDKTPRQTEFDAINNVLGYQTFKVNNISSDYRFYDDGTLEALSVNFNSIGVGDTVTITDAGAVYTTDLDGTYSLQSVTATTWQLLSPSSVTNEWNDIKVSTVFAAPATFTQNHNTDTITVNFSGSYTISQIDQPNRRVYFTAPSGPAWAQLPNVVGEQTGFSPTSEVFVVTNANRTINLAGTYTVVSADTNQMVLDDTININPEWALLQYLPNQQLLDQGVSISKVNGNTVGPYFIDQSDTEIVYVNVTAPNGLYSVYKGRKYAYGVIFEVTVRQADANGNAVGPSVSNQYTMLGSGLFANEIATTVKITLPWKGPVLVEVRRITPDVHINYGDRIDDIVWQDLYGVKIETALHFGNVTTVQTKTFASAGSSSLKERKLNCLATRKIPYITGFTGVYPNMVPVYGPNLVATDEAEQVLCAIAKDPYFGGREDAEIDYYGIFQAAQQVREYFQSEDATKFSYTFDDTNVSFEEAIQSVANAMFCIAYRQGSQIKIKPEIGGSEPVLIFNHRNKIPDTEKRTVSFSTLNDHDSVSLEWMDPDSDRRETIFIPSDQSGKKTKQIETIGIRNYAQAFWQAWRSYNKIKYQNTVAEFQSTQEAAILIQRDKVMLADNTRADTQDGEIWDQEVLQLTTSQDVTFKPNVLYTIFLQHYDGTVEAIPCTGVSQTIALVKSTYFLQLGGIRLPNPADAGQFMKGGQVAVTTTTFLDPVNGNVNLDGTYTIAGVDATVGIVLFENPGLVNQNWTKITTQESVLRVGVNYNATWNANRKVNLAYPPKAALSLDPENYARATYQIRGNDEVAPIAFMVQETTPKDNFSMSVSLINWDPRYYYMDDLALWVNFDNGDTKDYSAWATPTTEYVKDAFDTNTYITFPDDPERGKVFCNPLNNARAWIQAPTLLSHGGSYTKSVWVKKTGGFSAYFMSNASEQLRVTETGRVICGHQDNVSALVFPGYPLDGQWHQVTIVYDAPTLILRVYVDGVLRAQKVNVPVPTAGVPIQPVGLGQSGVVFPYCDDLRMWKRAFTTSEVTDLYNSTR